MVNAFRSWDVLHMASIPPPENHGLRPACRETNGSEERLSHPPYTNDETRQARNWCSKYGRKMRSCLCKSESVSPGQPDLIVLNML